MTWNELASLVRRSMSEEMFCKPGSVLFSGFSTIKRFRFYIMGLNPGGSSKVLTTSIIDALAPKDGTSPYTHECWNKACGSNLECVHAVRARNIGGRLAEGDLVKHQKNMICLSRLLGCGSPAEIPSVNAIFARSCSLATLKAESGFGADDWWRACWPIHQHLLEIVRPDAIITLGYGMDTSPLGFLARELRTAPPYQIGDENRRGGRQIDCSIRLITSTLNARVVGVPHPSYHAPGPQLSKILQALT
jgi:hypothetical protein